MSSSQQDQKSSSQSNSHLNKSSHTGGQKDNIVSETNVQRAEGPLIIYCDMNTEMKEFAFELAKNFNSYKFKSDLLKEFVYKGEQKYFRDGAETIKKQFDEKFRGSWHVIIGSFINLGSHFGCDFSYEQKNALMFKLNGILYLIFKFG